MRLLVGFFLCFAFTMISSVSEATEAPTKACSDAQCSFITPASLEVVPVAEEDRGFVLHKSGGGLFSRERRALSVRERPARTTLRIFNKDRPQRRLLFWRK